MPKESHPSSPRDLAMRAAGVWIIAGAIGLLVGIVLATLDPFSAFPGIVRGFLAFVFGAVAMLVCAPWRHTRALSEQRRLIQRFTRDLEAIALGERERRLSAMVVEGDDELSALSRAVHDVVVRSMSDRRESRRLQRTMDDTIQRETTRATARLQKEATTDPLTGLANRRTLDEKLEAFDQPDRRRSRRSMVAMVIDLDRFKIVNDSLGHDVGDECLLFLGHLLSSTLRHEDCAIRLGGDEFAVLMPDQSMLEARAVAERLAALFGQMPWAYPDVPQPTLSIGLALTNGQDPGGARDLLRRADIALYRSKSDGRNTIRTFAEIRDAA